MLTIKCGNCTSEWTGKTRCHCAACHNTFGGLTSFDKHRRSYKCLNPEDLDLHLNENGIWVSDYMMEAIDED